VGYPIGNDELMNAASDGDCVRTIHDVDEAIEILEDGGLVTMARRRW
jgi:hypothetical protein